MRFKISEFKKILYEQFEISFEEDVDRLRRAKDKYGETDFEEDVDRLRRAKDKYGETDFEEDVDRLRRAKDKYGETDFEESVQTESDIMDMTVAKAKKILQDKGDELSPAQKRLFGLIAGGGKPAKLSKENKLTVILPSFQKLAKDIDDKEESDSSQEKETEMLPLTAFGIKRCS